MAGCLHLSDYFPNFDDLTFRSFLLDRASQCFVPHPISGSFHRKFRDQHQLNCLTKGNSHKIYCTLVVALLCVEQRQHLFNEQKIK